MKCFVLKGGEILPADKVLDIRERNGKSIIKYQKILTLANTERIMTCYDEAIAFRNMRKEEEEEFGIKESEK